MSNVSPRRLFNKPAHIFYGWWIVAISLSVDALFHGTFHRGFSLYFLPIQSELGISRAAYSLADLVGRLAGAVEAPVVGYLINRLGSRTMMVAGGVLSGLGFILLQFTHSYLYFILVFVGLLSLANRVGYSVASIPAVTQWFRTKRSLAISVVSTGHGLGGTLITPLVGLMVFNVGWRTAAFVSGIVLLAVVVPLSLLVRQSPESMGLAPDGLPPSRSQPTALAGERRRDKSNPGASDDATVRRPASQASSDMDFTAKEAMSTPAYWLLVLSMGLRNSVWTGTSWHLVPLMVWAGVSVTTAAFLVGLMSFAFLVLNPFMGWAGDKWSKQRIMGAAMVVGALAMIVLMLSSGHLWQLAIFVITLAVAQSVVPLNSAILADFFGPKSYAVLHGWLQSPTQLMSMTTPVWIGWVFDQTGSYFWALVPCAVLYSLSAFSYLTLPRPKSPHRLHDSESRS